MSARSGSATIAALGPRVRTESSAFDEIASSLGAEIREGPVPEHLADATDRGPVHECSPGRYLLDLPSVGRFLVENGERVTIELAPDASPADALCFVRGPVRDACRLQQGRFALRAAAVEFDGGAVAISGAIATGKSVTAAALALRGHRVLSDASLPVDIDDDGRPQCSATSSSLDLWPDTVELMGLDTDAGAIVRPALTKRAHRFSPSGGSSLLTVVHLTSAADVGAPTIEPIRGFKAVNQLMAATAMQPLIHPYGLGPAHFRWMTAITRMARVVHLRTDRHHEDLDLIVDLVEQEASKGGDE